MDLKACGPFPNSGDTSQSETAALPPAVVQPNQADSTSETAHLSTVAISRLLNKRSVDSTAKPTTWPEKLTHYHDTLNHVEQSATSLRPAMCFSIMFGSVRRLFSNAPPLYSQHERTKIIQINRVWKRIMGQPANNSQSPVDLLFAFEEHHQTAPKKNGAKKETTTQNGGQQWKHDHHRCEIQSLVRFCINKEENKEGLLRLTKKGFTSLKQLGVRSDEIKIIASLVMTTNVQESSDYTFLLDIFSTTPSLLNKEELSAWLTAAFDQGLPDNLRAKYIKLSSAWLSSIHSRLRHHKHGLLPKKLAKEIDYAGPIVVRLSQIEELDGNTLSLLADWKAITLLDPLELELYSSEEIRKRISDLNVSNLLHYKALASVLKYIQDKQTTKTTPSSSSRPARSQSRPSEVSDSSKKSKEQEEDALLEQAIGQKLVNCKIIPKNLSPEEYLLLTESLLEGEDSPSSLLAWLEACPKDQPLPNGDKSTADKLIAVLLKRIVNEKNFQQNLFYLNILNYVGQLAKPEQTATFLALTFESAKFLFSDATAQYNERQYQQITQIKEAWEQIIAHLPHEYKPLVSMLFAFEKHQQLSSEKSETKEDANTKNGEQCYWTHDPHKCGIRSLAKLLSITKGKNKQKLLQLTREGFTGLKQLGVTSDEIKIIASLVMTTNPLELSDYTFLLDIFSKKPFLINKEELAASLIQAFDLGISEEFRAKYIELSSKCLSTIFPPLLRHELGPLPKALVKEIHDLTPLAKRISHFKEETVALLADWETIALFNPLELAQFSSENICARIAELNTTNLLHLKALASVLTHSTALQITKAPPSSSQPARSQPTPSSKTDSSGEKNEVDETKSLLKQAVEKKLTNYTTIPEGLSPEEYFLLIKIVVEQENSPFPFAWLRACPRDHSLSNDHKLIIDELFDHVERRLAQDSCSKDELDQITTWLSSVAFPNIATKQEGKCLHCLYLVVLRHQECSKKSIDSLLDRLLTALAAHKTKTTGNKTTTNRHLDSEWEGFAHRFCNSSINLPFTTVKLNAFREISKHIASRTPTPPEFFIQFLRATIAIKQQVELSPEAFTAQKIAALRQSFDKLRQQLDDVFYSIKAHADHGDPTDFQDLCSHTFLKSLDFITVIEKLLPSKTNDVWTPRLHDCTTCLFISLYCQSIKPERGLPQNPIFCQFVQALIFSFPNHPPTSKSSCWMSIGPIAHFIRASLKHSTTVPRSNDLLNSKSIPIFLDMALFFFQKHEEQLNRMPQRQSLLFFKHLLNSFEESIDFFALFKHIVQISDSHHDKILKIVESFASSDTKCVNLIIQSGEDQNFLDSLISFSDTSSESNPAKTFLYHWALTLENMRVLITTWIGKYLFLHGGQDSLFSFAHKYIEQLPSHSQEKTPTSTFLETLGRGRFLAKLFFFSLNNTEQLTTLTENFKKSIAHYTIKEYFFLLTNLCHESYVWILPKYMKKRELQLDIQAINKEAVEHFLTKQFRQLVFDVVERSLQEEANDSNAEESEPIKLSTNFSGIIRYIIAHNIATPISTKIFIRALLSAHLDFLAKESSQPLLRPPSKDQMDDATETLAWIAELFYLNGIHSEGFTDEGAALFQGVGKDSTKTAADLFQTIKAVIDENSSDIIKISFTTALLQAIIDNGKKDVRLPCSLYQPNREKWRHQTRTELLYQVWLFAKELLLQATDKIPSYEGQDKREALKQVVQGLVNRREEAQQAYCTSAEKEQHHHDLIEESKVPNQLMEQLMLKFAHREEPSHTLQLKSI
ncbi:hypothetical protein JYU14_00840 [Simkania negevensis]|uniref:Uncharacterized protein n=1 Tax=Simkania negevensis TaxID=83561 RepID=A0ABS3ASX9_9BACT|nr:hypothetical protein [Simkania negevensis]